MTPAWPAIDMNHALLSIAFPEFRFGYQPHASWAPRWIAVRKDIRTPGLHTAVTGDLDELVVLLGKAAVLMLPPWGILPPRHMMTTPSRAGDGSPDRHFLLPATWQRRSAETRSGNHPNGRATVMPLLDPHISATIGTLQSLDDAVAFRLGRLDLPCPDCVPERRCVAHSYDERLIERYQARYAAAVSDALAHLDPDTIAQVMPPGDAVPPATALLATAILTRLQEITIDGQVVTEPDSQSVTLDLDSQTVPGQPLPPADRD